MRENFDYKIPDMEICGYLGVQIRAVWRALAGVKNHWLFLSHRHTPPRGIISTTKTEDKAYALSSIFETIPNIPPVMKNRKVFG